MRNRRLVGNQERITHPKRADAQGPQAKSRVHHDPKWAKVFKARHSGKDCGEDVYTDKQPCFGIKIDVALAVHSGGEKCRDEWHV